LILGVVPKNTIRLLWDSLNVGAGEGVYARLIAKKLIEIKMSSPIITLRKFLIIENLGNINNLLQY